MKKYLILAILLTVTNLSYSSGILSTGWSALGSGTNGEVKAITDYNGNIVIGGNFTTAGGQTVNNIAMWNGTQWMPLGNGLNGYVNSVKVFYGVLYVAGNFTSASGVANTSKLAKWNGTNWQSVTNIFLSTHELNALEVFNNILYIGGEFNSGPIRNIIKYDGSTFSSLANGVNDKVNALLNFGSHLIVGGDFTEVNGNNISRIARYDGTNWSNVNGAIFNDEIFSLGIYDGLLYAGGRFTIGGGVQANYLVCFYGGNWIKVGNGVEDRIYAITYWNRQLVVAGQHKFSYNTNDTVYVNRISKFDGTRWSTFATGMNGKISALHITSDSGLIAAGEFTTAGGRVANRVARWDTIQTVSISGRVKFRGTNIGVSGGYVKAIRIDLNTRQALTVDSTGILPGGNYTLTKVRRNDTLDILGFPADIIEQDFIPTYHPSTIHWQNSVRLYTGENLNNIDIDVDSVANNLGNGLVNGMVNLNYTPPGFIGSGLGLAFKSSSIVYAKQNGRFVNFGISNNYTSYNIPVLPAGNYQIIVDRIGYSSDTLDIIVPSGGTVNNVNFTLKPMDNRVGISDPGITVVKDFALKQNYPNPFNPETTIEFTLQEAGLVSLNIYNILGMEVGSYYNTRLNRGSYSLKWNASGLSSGVYFYKLNLNGVSVTKSMLLLK